MVEPPSDVVDKEPHFQRQMSMARVHRPDVTAGWRKFRSTRASASPAAMASSDQEIGLAHDAQPGDGGRFQRIPAVGVQAAGHTHFVCLSRGIGEAPTPRRARVRIRQRVVSGEVLRRALVFHAVSDSQVKRRQSAAWTPGGALPAGHCPLARRGSRDRSLRRPNRRCDRIPPYRTSFRVTLDKLGYRGGHPFLRHVV